MQEFFGIVAGLLTLAGFVPLTIEAVRGPVRPPRATWLIWAVEAVLIYKTFAVSSPESNALWIPLGFVVGAAWIFLVSLRYGEGGWTVLDRWCLVGAGVTLLLWQTISPVWGLIAGIGTDMIGAVPTITQAWRDSETQSRKQWTLWWLGAIANLCAVGSWTVAEASYPVYGIVLTTAMIAIIARRKA